MAVGLAILDESRSSSLAVVLAGAILLAPEPQGVRRVAQQTEVDRTRAGLVSGVTKTPRQEGGSLKIALLATPATITTLPSAHDVRPREWTRSKR